MIKLDSRTYLYMCLLATIAVLSLWRGLSDAIAYDRDIFDVNHAWMLLTCHLSHLSFNHAVVNFLGMALLLVAFAGEVSGKESAILMLGCALMTGLGIHYFSHYIDRYYGFSGIIHGVLVGELLITITRFVWLHSIVILGIIGKVCYEWLGYGNLISSAEFIGGDVAVDAHLYGLLTGLVIGGLLWYLKHISQHDLPVKGE